MPEWPPCPSSESSLEAGRLYPRERPDDRGSEDARGPVGGPSASAPALDVQRPATAGAAGPCHGQWRPRRCTRRSRSARSAWRCRPGGARRRRGARRRGARRGSRWCFRRDQPREHTPGAAPRRRPPPWRAPAEASKTTAASCSQVARVTGTPSTTARRTTVSAAVATASRTLSPDNPAVFGVMSSPCPGPAPVPNGRMRSPWHVCVYFSGSRCAGAETRFTRFFPTPYGAAGSRGRHPSFTRSRPRARCCFHDAFPEHPHPPRPPALERPGGGDTRVRPRLLSPGVRRGPGHARPRAVRPRGCRRRQRPPAPEGLHVAQDRRGRGIVPDTTYPWPSSQDGQATFGVGDPQGGCSPSSRTPRRRRPRAAARRRSRSTATGASGAPDPRRHVAELRRRPTPGHVDLVRGARNRRVVGMRPDGGRDCGRPARLGTFTTSQ